MTPTEITAMSASAHIGRSGKPYFRRVRRAFTRSSTAATERTAPSAQAQMPPSEPAGPPRDDPHERVVDRESDVLWQEVGHELGVEHADEPDDRADGQVDVPGDD